MTTFEALGVSAPILRALETLSFTNPTEIQAATIPAIKEGNDVIGVAQTGSGKTAAFVIPAVERMSEYREKAASGMPRALILAPTRELAIQITDKIKELSVGMRVSCCTVYGGAPYKTQTHILKRGVDILVATPGRLRDHMKQGNIYLDMVEYFVLDEADRMLDMGFIDEVRLLAKQLPQGHQSVMFSATMTQAIRSLAETLLHNPVSIQVAQQSTITDNLDHSVMMVPGHKKNDLLMHLIDVEAPQKALIFVRTRRNADELCDYLNAIGLKADAIHGDKQQKARQRTIRGFTDGRFDFLVATDVAARGLDVKDITHVFNMDVPVESESYVHRIGRTARGTAHGKAITLCGKGDIRLLKAIEALIRMKIPVDDNHPFPLTMSKPPRHGERRDYDNKHRKTRKDRTPAGKIARGNKSFSSREATEKKWEPRDTRSEKAPRMDRDARSDRAPRAEREPRSERAPRKDRAPRTERDAREFRAPRPDRAEREQRDFREPRAPREGGDAREQRESKKAAPAFQPKSKTAKKKRPAVAARKTAKAGGRPFAAAGRPGKPAGNRAAKPAAGRGKPRSQGSAVKAGGAKPLMRKGR